MSDFTFLENPTSKKWVILAPRRAKRPDVAKGSEPVCPFCVGREKDEQELYRIGGTYPDSNWDVRVIPNKFPFTPHHEVIIHTPEHNKGFVELTPAHTAKIISAYRERYKVNQVNGQVYIFHNRGVQSGESLPHSHTQLAVVPNEIQLDVPRLDKESLDLTPDQFYQTNHFIIFCPKTSQWPDEVWVAPKRQGTVFGEITDDEIDDFSLVLTRLIQIFHIRHNNEFPHNYYIYPGGNWYFRLTPRLKTLGGFEIGTGIFVNTQNPLETIDFIKTHFENPDTEKILKDHKAEYHTGV